MKIFFSIPCKGKPRAGSRGEVNRLHHCWAYKDGGPGGEALAHYAQIRREQNVRGIIDQVETDMN